MRVAEDFDAFVAIVDAGSISEAARTMARASGWVEPCSIDAASWSRLLSSSLSADRIETTSNIPRVSVPVLSKTT